MKATDPNINSILRSIWQWALMASVWGLLSSTAVAGPCGTARPSRSFDSCPGQYQGEECVSISANTYYFWCKYAERANCTEENRENNPVTDTIFRTYGVCAGSPLWCSGQSSYQQETWYWYYINDCPPET